MGEFYKMLCTMASSLCLVDWLLTEHGSVRFCSLGQWARQLLFPVNKFPCGSPGNWLSHLLVAMEGLEKPSYCRGGLPGHLGGVSTYILFPHPACPHRHKRVIMPSLAKRRNYISHRNNPSMRITSWLEIQRLRRGWSVSSPDQLSWGHF